MPFLLFFSLFHTIVSWSWWEADDSVDRGTWYLYSPPKYPHITGDPLKRMVRLSHPHHTHACAYATLNCLSSPNYIHLSSFHLFCTFHSTHQGSEWRYCWNHPGKEERVFHFLFLHQSLWWKIELSGTHTKHSKGFFFFSLIDNTIRIKSMLIMHIHQPAKLFSIAVKTRLCNFCVLYCMITFECFCVFIYSDAMYLYIFHIT